MALLRVVTVANVLLLPMSAVAVTVVAIDTVVMLLERALESDGLDAQTEILTPLAPARSAGQCVRRLGTRWNCPRVCGSECGC